MATALREDPRPAGHHRDGETDPADTDPADELVDPYLDPEVEPDEAPMRAFDLLYARSAESLTRQTFLLCGDRRLAARAVVHAFRLAWERWPEVAVDRDPLGWVRAAAYEYALSPWHRLHPARVMRTAPRPSARRREPARTTERRDDTAKDGADTAAASPTDAPEAGLAVPDEGEVLRTLLSLPPSYRRCLLLHYGPGMGVTEIAAEVESSSAAVHGRLKRAHVMLVERVPELAQAPVGERRRLLTTALERIAEHAPGRPVPEERVREVCERLTRRRVLGAVLLLLLLVGAVVASLVPF
ncbi:RNA polymerase sigma factor [Streptomyces alkaliphilus]|uniref:RNA polymerase sigma factor n=1 Tax=Streptomyces alkaliphilus TaxID=1472722 RepID=UPI0034D19F61